ncbi:MAG: SHOCT domain-containing protein [Halobaculum sp.]
MEQYTPDGTFGRLLFGLLVGGPAGLSTLFGLGLVSAPPSAVAVLVGVLLTVVGLTGVVLSLVVLWPVYLSLIGNVERPSAYGVGRSTRRTDHALVADDPDDRVGILKRLYAEGELSHEEYERRLDALTGETDGDESESDTEWDDPVRERLRGE